MDLEDPVQLNQGVYLGLTQVECKVPQEILTQKQDLFDLIMNAKHPTALPQKDKHAYDPNADTPATNQHKSSTTEDSKKQTASPSWISKLLPNEIFVFGSNLKGSHGAGAARTAHSKFGAVYGIGKGRTGSSYAIPTKTTSQSDGLPTANISTHVREFTEYARKHPELVFLVTEIGCGLAGYEPESIAPLFAGCAELPNVRLPSSFLTKLGYKPTALTQKDNPSLKSKPNSSSVNLRAAEGPGLVKSDSSPVQKTKEQLRDSVAILAQESCFCSFQVLMATVALETHGAQQECSPQW